MPPAPSPPPRQYAAPERKRDLRRSLVQGSEQNIPSAGRPGRTRGASRILEPPQVHAQLLLSQRLSLQHQLLRGILGALYPCDLSVVNAVLPVPATPDGRRPQVLDVGSGSGLWFARRYFVPSRSHPFAATRAQGDANGNGISTRKHRRRRHPGEHSFVRLITPAGAPPPVYTY